ncbi:uncharacterized protein B0P05DRAFT_577293 [Gilbertella persicaria]|uniref:uncharacterized protein n=1 Tax=Gilbertella persicaria TaxID=101096 RepID=UPI002220C149|nr:uncharacterized protein B0P05DRAFT_577293 [Gilbertella persicaria]KAI8091191.1 hypothetical protein B0P05DRAFT_577293 [Gilbertella persicaria]
MSTERIFIVGGTGNIGIKAVRDLLANNVPVTLYARNPQKVHSIFTDKSDLIRIVQGDYSDFSPLKKGIEGHTRLFLLINDFEGFVDYKRTIAEYGYAAGVKQILDISSLSVNGGWRTSFIGTNHYYAEKAMFEIPNRGALVTLRPGRFMSNLFHMARIATDGAVFDDVAPEATQDWISTNDIGAVAAVILQDDIQKHGDNVYTLIGDVVKPKEIAAICSRLLGRDIPYKQVTAVQKFHQLVKNHVPFGVAMDLVDNVKEEESGRINAVIEIILGRKPETLEEYLTANKEQFQ